MARSRLQYRPAPVHLLAERLDPHETLPVSDELVAWGAYCAASSDEVTSAATPARVAVALRLAPRCEAAVLAGHHLGAASAVGREAAYDLLRAVFEHVPYRSDVHPPLLAVAGRAGFAVHPNWIRRAVSRTPVSGASSHLLRTMRRTHGRLAAEALRTELNS